MMDDFRNRSMGCTTLDKFFFLDLLLFRLDFALSGKSVIMPSTPHEVSSSIRVASLTDPWNEIQTFEKIVELLDEYDDWMPVILSNDNYSYFPDDIKANDLIIYTSEFTKEKLVHHFEKFGRKYTIG